MKENWEFSSLPPLEKAILIFAGYELIFGSNAHYPKIIIDQVINFSKVYLEEKKYKYINKVLDLLSKKNKEKYQKEKTTNWLEEEKKENKI